MTKTQVFIGKHRSKKGKIILSPGLKLYELYTRTKVMAIFETEGKSESLCDGQWVIMPESILCFATVEQSANKSFFRSAGRFIWVADKSYQVTTDEIDFLPMEVRGNHSEKREIYLFIRANERDSEFMYVDNLESSYTHGKILGKAGGNADFDMKTALPSVIWKRFGGSVPSKTTDEEIDVLLSSLPERQTWQERFEVLMKLVEFWHGPCKPEHGISEDELAAKFIPPPLLQWFRKGGKRKNILDGFNRLLTPAELSWWKDEEYWAFYSENQGVYSWSLRYTDEEPYHPPKNQLWLPGLEDWPKSYSTKNPELLKDIDDPKVWIRLNQTNEPWIEEEVTLSEFMIQACIFEGVNQAPYSVFIASEEEQRVEEIIAHLNEVRLGAWRWPDYPTRFYAKEGTFCCVSPNGVWEGKKMYTVTIGARTEHPLAFLKPMIQEHWIISF